MVSHMRVYKEMMQTEISHLTSSLPPSPERFRFSQIFLYLIAQIDCFASYRNTFCTSALRAEFCEPLIVLTVCMREQHGSKNTLLARNET